MGHARLVCIQILFIYLEKGLGLTIFPLPPIEWILQFLSTLFITMVLSVEETLMYFGYTYAPNLTHQGASVITKILSATMHANGYRNTTSPNTYWFTCSTKNTFPRGKNYTTGQKIDMRGNTKGSVHTVRGPKNPIERTMRHMRDCVQENTRTPLNDTFMVLFAPPPTFGPTHNLI